MEPLRLAFMGTPEFGVPTLKALLDAGHKVVCVYSQPPRPAGRGQQARPSPVQRLAEERAIEVRTPLSLKEPAAQAAFAALDLDAAVVVAYGLILPPPVLAAPRLGCLNLHASLLPRWRGAAPIQRAIMAGDRESGVAVMQMEAGLDTGPVVLSSATKIGPETTAGELHDRLSRLGAPLMVEALAGLATGLLTARPQPSEGVTYAAKISKDETRIDWTRPAAELDCFIRGLAPSPGAWSQIDGERLKILRAAPLEGSGAPGQLLDDHGTIACGRGALRLLQVQRQGKGALPAAEFLRGFALPRGACFR